jgi:hypothetical protein
MDAKVFQVVARKTGLNFWTRYPTASIETRPLAVSTEAVRTLLNFIGIEGKGIEIQRTWAPKLVAEGHVSGNRRVRAAFWARAKAAACDEEAMITDFILIILRLLGKIMSEMATSRY